MASNNYFIKKKTDCIFRTGMQPGTSHVLNMGLTVSSAMYMYISAISTIF